MRGMPALGQGVYTHREAALLAQLRPERVARWLRGYTFKRPSGKTGASGPVFRTDFSSARTGGGPLLLSFLDLVEVLFVRGFLEAGVSMRTVRLAYEEAERLYHVEHPFCVKKFETDGREIFATISRDAHDEHLVGLVSRQAAFGSIVRPLFKHLSFDVAGVARLWWPRGEGFPVVLDPARSFGAPIVVTRGVRTSVLAGPVKAGDSAAFVARMFDATVKEVEAAVEFEGSLLAMAA